MAKAPKVSKRVRRQSQRHRAPARHTLAKQGAAVLALGLGLVATAPAEASIVYQFVNQTVSGNSSDYSFVNYDGSYGSYIFHMRHWISYGSGGFVQAVEDSGGYVHAQYVTGNNETQLPQAFMLAKGATIDGTLYGFKGHGNSPSGFAGNVWGILGYTLQPYGYFRGKTGYVGLQFFPEDGTTHYAWAQFSMPEDASSVTLIDFAYETEDGTPIQAGEVPVPSSLVLLASGAAGLLAYRRMKKAS